MTDASLELLGTKDLRKKTKWTSDVLSLVDNPVYNSKLIFYYNF